MNKDTLKAILADQKESFDTKLKAEHIISRDGLDAAKKYIRHPNILLITGMRRAGKSVFAHLLAGKSRHAFVNFDDERLVGFKSNDFNMLLECCHELYAGWDVLILDEVQNVGNWELFASRLRENHKIIVTGSNANLLSTELASRLTGRFVAHALFPLSFDEFLRFNSFQWTRDSLHSSRNKAAIHGLFSKYLQQGGIFECHKFGDEFARSLFRSIITKDIALRYAIKHVAALEEFALLTVNYFTCKLSLSKVSASLSIKSPNTAREYLRYLENSFLLFTLNRFSYKVREQLSTFRKVYIADNGIIKALSLGSSQDKGKVLENLVAIELKRRCGDGDFSFFYWDNGRSECDFVARKGRKFIFACQVCYELNLGNRKRETTGLVGACKELGLREGTILTMDQEESFSTQGIKISVTPVWKWLLESPAGS
ncbi:MAG: ATP-binding protein [Elusimicrobia bacterium]|nr:ATP-binding protein [Elusimicrobiota bacterium]